MSCIITYKGQKYSEEQFKEYFNSNKQEFVSSIAKNKNVIDSFKRKMKGVDYVFSQSPELASIGSKAQYLQYLSTIFKTSKVRDIVYHGGKVNKEAFKRFVDQTEYEARNPNSIIGFFFSSSKNTVASQYAEKDYDAIDDQLTGDAETDAFIRRSAPLKKGSVSEELLDIKKPYIIQAEEWENETWVDKLNILTEEDKNNDWVSDYKWTVNAYEKVKNHLQSLGYDGLYINSDQELYKKTGIVDYITVQKVVFEPEQIHILSSKKDLEMFKNFVNNSNQKNQTVQSDQIYSNLGNKTQSENVVIDEVNGRKPAVGSNVKLTKKNIFTVKPIQSIDKKAIVKASIATQYIGFGEGIAGSSTALYAKQISEQSNNITPKVNSGNYSSNDVIFVSIGGKRGNEQIRKEQQDRTIKEALKAIEAGATLITDNKSYVESSDYNEGEKRLAKNLEAKGYTYSEQTIDGQILGIWSKSQSSNQIVAYRTQGNNFLEALEKDNAIGNPFGPYGQFKTPAGKVAVVEFIAWMIGEKHTDKLQDYRQSIIDKIPEMKGKTILYYKELGEASHATALDYLINKYDWRNNRPIAFNEQQSTTVKPAIRDIYEKTISSFLSAPVKKTSQEIISENLSKRKESVCDTNLCRVLMEELSKNLVVNGEKINDVDVPEIYITPMHKVLPILETILKQKNIPFTKAIDVLKYSISSIYMGKVLSNEESLTNDPTFFELANFLYLNTTGEDVKIDETVSIMNIARNNTVRLNDKETAEAVYGLNNVSDKRELLDRLPALITGSLEIGDLITNERALILCPELSKMTIEVNPNITESIIIKKTKDKAVPVLSLRRLSDSQGVIDEKVANKIESAIALFIQAKSGFLNGITSLNYEKNFQQLKDLNGLIITKLNLLESSSEEQRNTDKFKAIQYEVNMLNDTMYQLLKGLYKYNDDNPFANKQTVEILPISRKLSETAMKSSAYNGARLNPDGSVNLNSEQARTVMQSLGIYPVTEKKQLCRVP